MDIIAKCLKWIIKGGVVGERSSLPYDPNDLVVYDEDTPMQEKIYELLTKKRGNFVEV